MKWFKWKKLGWKIKGGLGVSGLKREFSKGRVKGSRSGGWVGNGQTEELGEGRVDREEL